MSTYFADTSYFLALAIPDDSHHNVALRYARNPGLSILTSEYVLVEVGNYLSSEATRHLFGALVQALRASPQVELVPSTSDLTWRAIDLYINRTDQSWSLTDCASFVIMRERRLAEALTADHHFEQAGFVALLRSAS